MERNAFIKEYAGWLEQGSAAVFVGAGLSRRAGYPDWRMLLRDIAKELNVNLDHEHDLAGVAQWYINKNTKQRTRIAQVIKESFPEKDDVPAPHRVLARLPLKYLWTTNYDRLIEKAWALQRRRIDVKSTRSHLGVTDPWADTVLYKMHGSVDSPSDVVIATDDYEMYRRTRAGFLQLLSGHLVGMHLLFIGISFSDPNLGHLLAIIRESMDDNAATHYAIVRRPKRRAGPKSAERLAYELSRHAHWIEDLKRYGIHCFEVDEYEDIDAILLELERFVSRRSVFVSGSYPEGVRDSRRDWLEELATGVGRFIGEHKLRLISGFGLVVGSAVVSGLLEKVYEDSIPALDKTLHLRPFPRNAPKGWTKEAFHTRYREDLIKQAGVCVFIGGYKRSRAGSDEVVATEGVLAEYEIARANGKIIVPVAASGGSALEIWNRLKADGAKASGLPPKVFAELGTTDLKKAMNSLERALMHVTDKGV